MSLADMSVRRLVGMAVNRRPVLVDGQPARLIGVPRADPGQARIEYPGGRRRTVPLTSVEIPSGAPVDGLAGNNAGIGCGENQVGPALRKQTGPGPQPLEEAATWAS